MTEVPSPITGSVWKVLVENGASIGEGETLVILESMKMEIRVKSPHNGRVVEIRVKEGDSILEDDVVAIIE
ncbi:MAG TPA: acetyl-CoA carboxylase biotin carboxyl carrier protein subunit [Dehalococcoidia bacterium]|jgi:biotin carboxyl carrier protein|nr:acetyl-CoA carboxylase biotin carboxyl carrier protein subunit [Dehalococcoidia bacterium]